GSVRGPSHPPSCPPLPPARVGCWVSHPDQHAPGDRTNDRRSQEHWRLWVDTGGTFTDCIGLRTSGTSHEIRRAKVLSSGALRGRASGMPAPNVLRVGPEWLGSLVQGHAGAAASALIG